MQGRYARFYINSFVMFEIQFKSPGKINGHNTGKLYTDITVVHDTFHWS